MKIYNTLSREIEEFIPLDENLVKIYACGPTVYAMPHVGNFRSFFLADLLRRYLKFKGYQVTLCMNITDIDDKTIRDSEKEDIPLNEFTKKYIVEFFRGLDMLNIKPADIYPRATNHITGMIELVEKLEEKGFAYEKDGSVYFNIQKMPNYGSLSKIDLSNLEIGKSVDVDEYEKENPIDFVLWKKSTKNEVEREIYWETKWGKGRPGWHIECSVMSMKYLGDTFDIHLGGVDLVFPHHENEIAQSECATNSQFVKYWVHGGHLIVDGRKMSKSKGNYFTLDEIMDKYDVNVMRYFFMSRKYRDTLNYTEQGIDTVKTNVEKLKTTLGAMNSVISRGDVSETLATYRPDIESEFLIEVNKEYLNFVKAMDNDLDSPLALQALVRMTRIINSYLNEDNKNLSILIQVQEIYYELLDVLGFFEEERKSSQSDMIPELMNMVLQIRKDLRTNKQYELSDQIRDTLASKGIKLKDTPQGTQWEFK